jgi:hypothetical protein
MIHEYAIDPALAVAWAKEQNEYEYYYEKFGLGQPRIMSEFPKFKNWRKQFKQAAEGAQDFELQRITAFFSLLIERRVRRDGFAYDGNISWLENAETEHGRYPFQAVLASENPRRKDQVLTAKAIKNHPLWKVEEQGICPRTALDMVRLISPMLSNCYEVHFIDPHFGPENVRHRRPLKAFLKEMANHRHCRPVPQYIEIHTSAKAEVSFFVDTCREKLPGIVPAGMCVRLKRWIEEPGGAKLHERYILTDVGGIKVGPGLDDGKVGENFEVMLLRRNMYEKQWNDYVESPAFDLAEDPIEILGEA